VLFRPVLDGALAPVDAARFTPFDVKFPKWIERGSADAAMFLDFEDRYETAQEARREALLGFDYADKGMATNAIACWAKAASVNPRDPILIELADALDKEARSYLAIGNVNGALRCYENRLEVFPGDVATVHNFGVCLKKAGHHKVAVRVFAKAVEMDPLHDVHRIELIDCADAAGYSDIAVRNIDVLLKRRPDDLELKKRRANILVRMHLEKSERRKKRDSNTPSRYLNPRQKKGKGK
jgi:tetratricopeptide (TPR) repeat protein